MLEDSKLESVKKRLSLDDICSQWAHTLNKREQFVNIPIPFSLTWFRWRSKIVSRSECMVGEAHNYSPNYNCDECDKFADNFSLYFYIHSAKEFERTTDSFVEHWDQNHLSK